MKTFSLTVVSPDGTEFSGDVQSLTVRTTEGDVQILAGHIPYLGAVAVGPCRIRNAEGELRIASCAGGFLSVAQSGVKLVSTTFEFADEIDLERAKKAKERAEEVLKNEKDSKKLEIASAKLSRALNRISVAESKF